MKQLQWGEWQFRAHLEDHHIGIQDLKVTSGLSVTTNTTTEGASSTVVTRNPKKVTFYLNYVLGHTNQTLESLTMFWQDKVGQVWPMIWGGDRAPLLTPNWMRLDKADATLILHKGGSFAVARIDFEFTEVLADNTANNATYGF